jgi:putative salt-induced outer membrane protein YdiY
MKRKRLLGMVFAMMFATVAHADQVTLKNGDRLSGAIVRGDDKALLLKTEYAGGVNIQWPAITAIQSAGILYIGLKDGRKISGVVTTSGENLVVAKANVAAATEPKVNVTFLRSEAEEALFIREGERRNHPALTDFWGGFLDTGLAVTRGNSDTLSFNLSGQAVRKAPRDTFTIYAKSIFANNGTNGPTMTTANSIGGGMRLDYNLKPRLFVFGLADFYHDEFQQLDIRAILGAGAGYHAIQTKPTTFDIYGGATYNRSDYSTLNRNSSEIMAGEFFSHNFSERTSFNERFEVFPNLSETGQYRFTLDMHIVTKLGKWLSWQAAFDDLYVSNPPVAGVDKNDVTLTTGLRVAFGEAAK